MSQQANPPSQPVAIVPMPASAYPAHPGKGRPLLLTPEVADAIVATVGKGGFVDTAARALGIHKHTINRWLVVGRAAWHAEIDGTPCPQSDRPFLDLCIRVEIARAQAMQDSLAAIRQSGEKDWKAHQYYLAVMDGARYGQQAIARPETGYVALQDAERLLAGLATIAQEMRDAAEAHTDPVVQAALCEQVRDYVGRVTDLAQELADRMPGRLDEPAE